MMAGRGGPNLTHAEPLLRLLSRYGTAPSLARTNSFRVFACIRGEAVITETGLEGGALYTLSARLRDTILARVGRRSSLICGPI
jgi:predicted flavoprotein YhiN